MSDVSAQSKDALAPSRFWQSSGSPAKINEVHANSSEERSLKEYFFRHMPRDVCLHRINRVENRQTWTQYKVYLNNLNEQSVSEGAELQGAEMYLWHGTHDVDATVKRGFEICYSSMEFNMYGAGLYFGVDPRLSHRFCRKANNPRGECKLILARVAVGWCAEKAPLPSHAPDCRYRGQNKKKCEWNKCLDMRARDLRKPENRVAPEGYHSCTSRQKIEVVVYKDMQAYPAYIFEYTCPSLADFDPYHSVARLGCIRWGLRSDYHVHFEAVEEKAKTLRGALSTDVEGSCVSAEATCSGDSSVLNFHQQRGVRSLADQQLPPGWTAKWNENEQCYFFIDLERQTSQWEPPPKYVHKDWSRHWSPDDGSIAYWSSSELDITFCEGSKDWRRREDLDGRFYWSCMVPTVVEYEIEVDKRLIGSRFGIDYSADLKIKAIWQGLVRDWNAMSGPEKQVRIGDVIIEVNGKTDLSAMKIEIRDGLVLVVRLRRPYKENLRFFEDFKA